MTEIEVVNIVKGYINNAQDGLQKESPKMDFKNQWYNLTNEEDINEFIKDTSSIANTPGLDGFIVIGFNDRDKTFSPAFFSQCNLRDTSDLVGMVVKRVDRNFHLINYDILIDGHKLSILHIPPSFDKPHVIRSYKSKSGKTEEHRVFIRYGTSTRIATKYDLDFIAYDRKNNIPEYSLFMSTTRAAVNVSFNNANSIDLSIVLIIENNGLRPVAISEIVLNFIYPSIDLSFESRTNKAEQWNSHIKVSNIIIQAGQIGNFSALTFASKRTMTHSEFFEFQKKYTTFDTIEAAVRLNNENIITTKLHIV